MMVWRVKDFRCLECGRTEERLYKIYSDGTEQEVSCNACGSVNVEKLVSAPAISYSATMSLTQSTPDGFKDILRNIDKNTPAHMKGDKPSAI